MSKLYELFNLVETDLPINKELSNEETSHYFNQFQSSIQPNNKMTWLQRKSTILAAAALLLTPTVFLNDNVQAAAGKLLMDMTYSMSDIISPKARVYATHINETLSVNGVDYKLTDVYADDQYLTYNLLIDYPNNMNPDQHNVGPLAVKLNGHQVMQGAFGSSESIDKKQKIISNTESIQLSDNISTGKQQVELTFGEMSGKNQAVYQIAVDSRALTKDTKVHRINHTISTDKHSINIKRLTINPLTARLNLTYKDDKEVYDVTVKDNKGKKYQFDTNSVNTLKGESSHAMLTFNPDFSTGNIGDLNQANMLMFYFTGREAYKNGESKDNFTTDDKEAFRYELKS